MIVSLLIPVLAVVVYLLVRSSRAQHEPGGGDRPAGSPSPPPHVAGVVDELERWRTAGLLTDEQVAAILEHERLHRPLPPPVVPTRPDHRPGRLPDLTEALGYLGGVLAIVGMSLLVGRYWSDIPLAGRLGLSGGLAAALFAVGLLVPEDREPALRRMRWFLWTVSSAATAVFGGVLAHDVWDGDPTRIALVASVAVVLHDVALWWRRDRPLQQLTFLTASAVAVGTTVAEISHAGPAGVAVWALGAVGVAFGLRHLTRLPILTLSGGAVTALVGSAVISGSWQAASLLLSTATALALLALASVRHLPTDRGEQVVLTVIGAVALFSSVPGTVGYFAEQAALTTGLVVWAIGASLVVVGGRSWLRTPMVATLLGGAALIGGAALVAIDLERVGPVFGIATALALVAAGVMVDRFVLSTVGSVGLLVHVPWAILEWFPGEGRAPLLIMVSGALIIAIAVFLGRSRDRFRHLGGPPPTPPHAIT